MYREVKTDAGWAASDVRDGSRGGRSGCEIHSARDRYNRSAVGARYIVRGTDTTACVCVCACVCVYVCMYMHVTHTLPHVPKRRVPQLPQPTVGRARVLHTDGPALPARRAVGVNFARTNARVSMARA